MTRNPRLEDIEIILGEAKKLSKQYKAITGKPLGITGEVAEFEAARHLGLILAPARSPGFDAIRIKNNIEEFIQIKGRSYSGKKGGQRIGKLDFKKKWHKAILVLLDENYELLEIYEASKEAILARLEQSKAKLGNIETHTQKGALTVSMFRSIAGAPLFKKS